MSIKSDFAKLQNSKTYLHLTATHQFDLFCTSTDGLRPKPYFDFFGQTLLRPKLYFYQYFSTNKKSIFNKRSK